MNKQEFLNYLKEGTEDADTKVKVLQYFCENYPVAIDQIIPTAFGNIKTGRKIWTSLPDYKVKDDSKAMNHLDENFNKLQLRVKELEDYDKE